MTQMTAAGLAAMDPADRFGWLVENRCRRITRKDPSLPHQIVIGLDDRQHVAVSCNCLRVRGERGHVSHQPIEIRPQWERGEAIKRWRQHLAEAEAALA